MIFCEVYRYHESVTSFGKCRRRLQSNIVEPYGLLTHPLYASRNWKHVCQLKQIADTHNTYGKLLIRLST